MLSSNELANLFSVISDETKTFELIAANFQKTFNKADQFKVGVTLWFLLKDNVKRKYFLKNFIFKIYF
jgi:hypothetical protein